MKVGKHIAIIIAVLIVSTASLLAAPIVTNMQLDTENDLLDIGDGTKFHCDINGENPNYGNNPWTGGGGVLYDNSTNTESYTQYAAGALAPSYVGVYGMPEQYRLGGFAVTRKGWYADYYPSHFKIQGSNDSTNGWEGTWIDIFEYSGTPSLNSTYRWEAKDNNFLTSKAFTCFRLAETNQYCKYAEIEFFGPAVPEATVIIIK